jgi:hypothetical protein
MAIKERQVKGSDRQAFLVLPYVDGDENESNPNDSDDYSEHEVQLPPAKRPLKEKAQSVNKKPKGAGLPVPTVDGEELVQIYIGNAATFQKVFQLTRNKIRKSSFLHGLVQGNPPFVFHPTLYEMSPDEFEIVHTYLSGDDDVDADLVRDDNLEMLVDEPYILGDGQNIGRSYMLKNIQSIEDLTELIPRLGKLYEKARLLGLEEMATSTILKLQVAWNIYYGAPQLVLFLDFIEGIMPRLPPIPPSRNVFVGHTAQAPPFGSPSAPSPSCSLQQWIVNFLAETLKLYLATDLQRFWTFMGHYPWMQAAVFARRAQFCNKHIGDLHLLERALLQREPFDATKTVRFEHAQQETQQEVPQEVQHEAQHEVQQEVQPEAQKHEQKAEKTEDDDALFCGN